MSWQCPIYETVNQDVTPICTVCENLAPVIDSYLSLEAIERIGDYNKKLDEVHKFEVDKAYGKMLEASIEAISLYKENSLALEKAKQALIYLQQQNLNEKVFSLLDSALERNDLNNASVIIKLAGSLAISNDVLERKRMDIKIKLSRKKEVDQLLEDSYLALISLDIDNALHIIEEGMIKHTNSKRLKKRREEIKQFITAINENKENIKKKKKAFPHVSTLRQDKSKDKGKYIVLEEESKDFSKRKFPNVKRT